MYDINRHGQMGQGQMNQSRQGQQMGRGQQTGQPMTQGQPMQGQHVGQNLQMPQGQPMNQQISPEQMAIRDAQQIQQPLPGLMDTAFDNSMNNYRRAYDDVTGAWNNSEGLMGFSDEMRRKGYRGNQPMEMQQPTSIEQLGYVRY